MSFSSVLRIVIHQSRFQIGGRNVKKKLVDFDTSEVLLTNENIKFEQISSKDIAVIGVSCQIGSAKNTNEFWDSMVEGKCLVEEIPQARQKDITDALKQSGITHQEFKKASYLGSIDTFDYKFFLGYRGSVNGSAPKALSGDCLCHHGGCGVRRKGASWQRNRSICRIIERRAQ